MQEETHSKDVFVINAKKKFVDSGDITIIHFMNEIIDDIAASSNSAYVLFDSIVNLDPYEEFNARAGELLLDYGKGISFDGDTLCYAKYMEPLKDSQIKTELRNSILMRYLEETKVEEL